MSSKKRAMHAPPAPAETESPAQPAPDAASANAPLPLPVGGFRHWPAYLVGILVLVGFDHWTKFLSIKHLMPGPEHWGPAPSVTVIPGLFKLQYAENRGAAFSMFDGKTGLLAVVSVAASIGLIYWWTRVSERELWGRVALAMVIGGAVGNFIDRAFRGYVVDMFLAYYQKWSWPVFNVADTAICIGVGILLVRAWKGRV